MRRTHLPGRWPILDGSRPEGEILVKDDDLLHLSFENMVGAILLASAIGLHTLRSAMARLSHLGVPLLSQMVLKKCAFRKLLGADFRGEGISASGASGHVPI